MPPGRDLSSNADPAEIKGLVRDAKQLLSAPSTGIRIVSGDTRVEKVHATLLSQVSP